MNSMETRKNTIATSDGRFAYDGLDRAIHEKARLGILTSLVAHPKGLLFNDLKELCSLTDGNLNRHLAVLEESGLVATNRPAKRGRPQTVVVMTAAGRRRFQQYLNVLEQVLADAAASCEQVVVKRSRVVPGISTA
jgi:DNA-binding MarR family transcriptional regulator